MDRNWWRRRARLYQQRCSPSIIDGPLPDRGVVKEEEHVSGPASAKLDVSILENSLETTTLEGARHTVKVQPPPPILTVRRREWGMVFYIRTDRGGLYHAYPHVGRPFQSLQEAQNAIDRFLYDRRDPTMFMPGLSYVERSVKWKLHWPDGTRKTPSKSHQVDVIRNSRHQLAQAVVDVYNEEHSLMEDLAYQVKEVVCYQPICEGDVFKWYHHINFTAKAKGVDDHGITNLFFAEVISSKKGQLEEFVPSCLQMLQPSDNGTCHGCQNNASGEHMKHPKDASAYTGGHARVSVYAFRGSELPPMAYPVGDEDELHRTEEARLRAIFTAYEDEHVFDMYKNFKPVREPVTEAMRQQWLAIGGT